MKSASSSFTISTQYLGKPISDSYDLLHSVQKPLYKPWRKPVAPLPRNPTRFYKVKPVEFKDVVQKLTGAAEFQPSRLQTVAPAPLDLNLGGIVRVLPERSNEVIKRGNAMGFALSPSSSAWCSFLMLSPGNMPGLDQSTVLYSSQI